MPTVTPRAPGNLPNRWSNVRFSLMRKTTCLIGHRVGNAFASICWAADGLVTDGEGAVGRGVTIRPSSPPTHPTARSAAAAIRGAKRRIGGVYRWLSSSRNVECRREEVLQSFLEGRHGIDAEVRREHARQRRVHRTGGWQVEIGGEL